MLKYKHWFREMKSGLHLKKELNICVTDTARYKSENTSFGQDYALWEVCKIFLYLIQIEDDSRDTF